SGSILLAKSGSKLMAIDKSGQSSRPTSIFPEHPPAHLSVLSTYQTAPVVGSATMPTMVFIASAISSNSAGIKNLGQKKPVSVQSDPNT
ncbi:hypothetical protein, partial [uncultured Halopseudomonas sp.]|uniref:hypothetical protein n=1 Tax=uncultured Halopseudomonas sp. TaxID=2901193 RepID=UPI0030ED3951